MFKDNIINITPYKELHLGELSIYDFVDKNAGTKFSCQVIEYLQTQEAYVMSPGIYEHPFKKGQRLLGPYCYTDGKYSWDRDTWKYVLKYGLQLPADFIAHVLSDEGKKFLTQYEGSHKSWKTIISKWKATCTNGVVALPNDAGDITLDEF